MSETNGIKSFWMSLLDYWIFWVTSSVLAALLSALSLFGFQVPLWLGVLVFVLGLLLAVVLAGLNEHQERLKLAERLRPKLSICEDTQASDHHRRIKVRNLTDVTIRFGAELVSIDPKPEPEYPMPARLQLTATQPPHREGELPGKREAFVDVFRLLDDGNFGLLVASYPTEAPVLIQRASYEIRICVFPTPPFEGEPAFRSFRIVPDPSREGGIAFDSV